jgi:hypothetical protein
MVASEVRRAEPLSFPPVWLHRAAPPRKSRVVLAGQLYAWATRKRGAAQKIDRPNVSLDRHQLKDNFRARDFERYE